MTAHYAPRNVTRATVGDEFYGPSCPECSNPKDMQALECRECYRDRMRDASYWDRRTCSCGAKKGRESPRCRNCYRAGMRTVGLLT